MACHKNNWEPDGRTHDRILNIQPLTTVKFRISKCPKALLSSWTCDNLHEISRLYFHLHQADVSNRQYTSYTEVSWPWTYPTAFTSITCLHSTQHWRAKPAWYCPVIVPSTALHCLAQASIMLLDPSAPLPPAPCPLHFSPCLHYLPGSRLGSQSPQTPQMSLSPQKNDGAAQDSHELQGLGFHWVHSTAFCAEKQDPAKGGIEVLSGTDCGPQ